MNLFLDIKECAEGEAQFSSDEKAISFGNYIRAGLKEKMGGMLDEHGVDLLKTWFTLQVYLKRTNSEEGENENVGDIRRNSNRNVTVEEDAPRHVKNYQDVAQIEVTPLHLAILSRQEASLEAILENTIPLYSASAANFRLPTRMIDADQILFTRVKVNYPGRSVGTYSDEDCMLDGMNIFHLATRYFPKGLETIIRLVRRQDGLMERLKHLIEQKDNQIENTPLHVAATCGSIFATRYTLLKT